MRKKERIALIFPHQLFDPHPLLDQKIDKILLVEHPRFYNHFVFHKQKLVFHRATMKEFEHLLKSRGNSVETLHQSKIQHCRDLREYGDHFLVCDPVDTLLEKELEELANQRDVTIFDTPQFLNDPEALYDRFEDKAHLSMTSFYISERKRLKIMVQNGKPFGSKWSFDPENRKKMGRDVVIPSLIKFKPSSFLSESIKEIEKEFPLNPGSLKEWFYPLNHKQANLWLESFLELRLKNFGIYQDSMVGSEPLLFHSLLSPFLNSGLLTPLKVVEKTLKFADHHSIPLNSLEGFIRQIIGWREFVRASYLTHGDVLRSSNFFKHKNKLPQCFWEGTTGIDPIDSAIKKLLKNAYLHHIERLMLIGNFMLLCEINPHDAYQWFMELFIDAYDWVMVPNVYGMSQYAAGNLMTTKPYFSSSNYLLKMGDFKKGEWCVTWDALFWNFVHSKKEILKANPRLNLLVKQWDRKEMSDQKKSLKIAEAYLHSMKF